jgi:uncharacterized membrane protein YkvA (DUF1232 family)
MNTQYNLDLTNEVSVHFTSILNKPIAKEDKQIIKEAKYSISNIRNDKHETFVVERIVVLEKMLQMLADKKWSLSNKDRHNVLSALQYFSESNDVIPDEIPGIGLLDDCIVIEIVETKIKKELKNYKAFKKAEEIYAQNSEYSVDDWHKTQKNEKFSRLRNRRNRRINRHRTSGSGFTFS